MVGINWNLKCNWSKSLISVGWLPDVWLLQSSASKVAMRVPKKPELENEKSKHYIHVKPGSKIWDDDALTSQRLWWLQTQTLTVQERLRFGGSGRIANEKWLTKRAQIKYDKTETTAINQRRTRGNIKLATIRWRQTNDIKKKMGKK